VTGYYKKLVFADSIAGVVDRVFMVREPALGVFTLSSLVPVVYLSAFGTIALGIATRRMTRMLLS
jgi:hypothetical protein